MTEHSNPFRAGTVFKCQIVMSKYFTVVWVKLDMAELKGLQAGISCLSILC